MAARRPKPKEPKTNAEQTGEQDLLQTIGALGVGPLGMGYDLPMFAGAEFASSAGGFGGGFGGCSGWGGSNFGWGGWSWNFMQPVSALVGSGTFEGTNKYGGPFCTGGLGLYGLLPGVRPYPGTYTNYRIMTRHTTVVLAAMALMMPVLAAKWNIEVDDNAPKEAEDLIQKQIVNNRTKIVLDHLKALFYGFASFEKVWTTQDGYLVYSQLKPLLPDMTRVMIDSHGQFAGLKQKEEIIEPPYCHIFSYGKEGDNWYGCPMLENCRRPWSNQLNVEDNLERLGVKASSIIPIVKHPPGMGYDENGTQIPNSIIAGRIGYGLASGRPVKMENLAVAGNVADIIELAKRAKGSLWDIDTVNLGECGPMVTALVGLMDRYDKQIVRGFQVPERAALEARHVGGRGDASQHTDLHLMGCQFIHNIVTSAINGQANDEAMPPGLVDDLLRYNFGEKAVGTARVVPEPLVDEQKNVDLKLLDMASTDPMIVREVFKRMDLGGFLTRVGAPLATEETKPQDKIDPAVFEQEDADPLNSQRQNKKPSSNGNGSQDNESSLA